MKTQLREETERIRQKNSAAATQAYQNMHSAVHGKTKIDGMNAILKFLNEKRRVDTELTLTEQRKYIEEQLCIKTRYVTLEDDWYKTLVIPMLAETVDGDWFAVIPHTDGTCVFVQNGKKIKITKRSARLFSENAICFYKSLPSEKITMHGLITFMLQCISKKDKITAIVASVFAIFAGMLLPWANNFIFSRVIPTGAAEEVLPAAALIFSAVSIGTILTLLQSLVLTNGMLRCGAYVQSGIFLRLLSLKPEFFKNMKSGALSRMVMEFTDITKIVSVRSVGACIRMFLSLLYLIQIYVYAPGLFGWILLVTIILGGMLLAEGILNARWLRDYSASLSKMSGFCYELFSGIEQVKLNGAEARMMKRWSERYLDVSIHEDKPFFLKYANVFYRLLKIFTTAVIFIGGAQLLASNYIAFSAAYGAYTAATIGVSAIIESFSAFRSSYTLIQPVLEAECEEYGGGKKQPEALTGDIFISDLYFRYNYDTPYILQGLSAHIKPGESVGIIGPSGCGKSTLLRLLLGFEEAEQGSIYIDGFDIRELDLKSYRQKIGTVLQNTGLISGDIYSNITITKPGASMKEVEDAIELAGLSEDIAALPMGVHTPVSQENCTLSGGQRQRVLIARALIAKPEILIFDEATSALDNITQAKITESVNLLSCTKIIVAHRLSTIESCDKILVIDKGVIVQEGTMEELKEKDGLFKQLLKRQITHSV